MADEAADDKGKAGAHAPQTDLSKVVPQSFSPRPPKGMEGNNKTKMIAGVVVAAVVVIALAYLFLGGRGNGISLFSTSSTSTIPAEGIQASNISACTTITQPGHYHIIRNISTSIGSGSCINVRSSNVNIDGKGHLVSGDGPFIVQSPSTYAINIYADDNVTVSNIAVAKFSYGFFVQSSNYVDIINATVENSTISGIYLNYSTNSKVSDSHVSGSTGQVGGISIIGGGDNLVDRTQSDYNSYYGMQMLNSTGNAVYNSTIIGNPVDLACSANSSFAQSNKFSNTTCYINNQCEFAYCSQVNNQFSLSQIRLGTNINTCGSIVSPGVYDLEKNLNMADYLNVSISQNSYLPCIIINASNVELECNGHSIINAPYGVASSGQYNVSVSGCTFKEGKYGLFMNNTVKFSVHSVSAFNSKYGIYIAASSSGNLTNITANGNEYGVYFNGSVYDTLTRYTAMNNTYGITVDNSTNVNFVGGSSSSSSKTDFYCTPRSYNSTLISTQSTQCTTTDCNWATSCPVKQLPDLNSSYPVTSCAAINAPGQYSLHNNIIANSTCFRIDSDNVSIDCANHQILGTAGGVGFLVNNKSNVVLLNCNVQGFRQGIAVSGSKFVVIKSTSIDASSGSGITINNSVSSVISNDLVSRYTSYGFSIYKDNSSIFTNDTAQSQVGTYGFYIKDAFKNQFNKDTANASDYGYYIVTSLNNFIKNNTGIGNKVYDFYCDPSSSGIYAQTGMINSGVTNAGCYWLVETSSLASTSQSCSPIKSADTVTFSQDEVYPYANTCFDISSNASHSSLGTTINCNGHTIYATHGGTFVSSVNTSNVDIENCVLIGFTTPIVFNPAALPATGLVIFNNTIAGASNAIYINNAKVAQMLNNYITNNSGTAITLVKFNYSKFENNIVNGSVVGVEFYNSTTVQIINNTVNASKLGIGLNSTIFSTMSKNNILSKLVGLYCSSVAGSKSSINQEMGQNICSSQEGCQWITSPDC